MIDLYYRLVEKEAENIMAKTGRLNLKTIQQARLNICKRIIIAVLFFGALRRFQNEKL